MSLGGFKIGHVVEAVGAENLLLGCKCVREGVKGGFNSGLHPAGFIDCVEGAFINSLWS